MVTPQHFTAILNVQGELFFILLQNCRNCIFFVKLTHFQITSPVKPLGQLKPRFSLQRLGEEKVVQMV